MNVQFLTSRTRSLTLAGSLAMLATVYVVYAEPFRTDASWLIERALMDAEAVGPGYAIATGLRPWFGLSDDL